MDILTSVEGEAKGVLKSQQRAQAFKALVLLKKNIRKYVLARNTFTFTIAQPTRAIGRSY
jgi:hypothetical protein